MKENKDVKEFQKNITTADVSKESYQFKRLWLELHNLELSSDKYFTEKVMKRPSDITNQTEATSI